MKFGEEIENMKKQVNDINEEQHSLAYELLQDAKKRSKRDFIEKIILIVVLIISNIAWLIYINQFDFSTEYTDVDSGNGIATVMQNSESGDINYGEN